MNTAANVIPKQADDDNRLDVAITEKAENIHRNLTKYQIKKDDLHILMIAYKDADTLEIYAKNKKDEKLIHIQSYPICARSGILGPKKKEGDKQVPEGFYHINRFNPKSLFYLSLGINYPNELDKSLGYTGSDIFIHGQCKTTGCLPMTDDLMKEIYVYATWAKDAGQQQIPVYIFPFKMTTENMKKYRAQTDEITYDFWKNLEEGYRLFHKNPTPLKVNVINQKYTFE